MKNTTYSYSSVQVNLPSDLSKEIIQWGEDNISENIIYRDPKESGYGREDEIHVTVLYGLHSQSSKETRMVVKDVKPFEIELGKIKIFDTSDFFDVVMIDVKSDELHKLNRKLRYKVNYTNKYSKYQPHVTIAYVKHGNGKQYVGNTSFEKKKFIANHVVFSSKAGEKEKIKINENNQQFSSFMEGFNL